MSHPELHILGYIPQVSDDKPHDESQSSSLGRQSTCHIPNSISWDTFHKFRTTNHMTSRNPRGMIFAVCVGVQMCDNYRFSAHPPHRCANNSLLKHEIAQAMQAENYLDPARLPSSKVSAVLRRR